MTKKQIITFGGATILAGFVVGAIYSGLAADLVNPGRSLLDSYENKTLLNATTTAGNATRHATSTPIQIGGAKKIVFQFEVSGTTTIQATDFFVYVSPYDQLPDTVSPSSNYAKYEKFTDFVLVNGTSPTTADTYFARTGATGITVTPAANRGATTTAAMDLTFGAWRSMICVASSTLHAESTCTALIQY